MTGDILEGRALAFAQLACEGSLHEDVSRLLTGDGAP